MGFRVKTGKDPDRYVEIEQDGDDVDIKLDGVTIAYLSSVENMLRRFVLDEEDKANLKIKCEKTTCEEDGSRYLIKVD
jgi:hypothetical protein